MKRHLVLLVAMLLMQAAAVSVFAQDKPKAGDIISGFVDDDYGPLTVLWLIALPLMTALSLSS